ncbi:uncharacterized protein isoform X2 [Choristoneura fumiferana]|uniref:uncharacterized protein isoform X4 n=1 Tax=Choristoneura fumiferana TaxID=7141 RepID=UPI003D157A60
MSEADNIKKLKRSKASIKAKLTQFEKYLNTAISYENLSDAHVTELECRLSRIENLINDFDTLQCELELLCDPPDEQYADREMFESQYYRLVASARNLLPAGADKDGSPGSPSRSGSVASYDNDKSVKAVHLELVTDLTKEAYIAALQRFISRRGKPLTITSDHGTNFVGACNELTSVINKSNLASDLADEGIKFLFTPAYSPHFNGLAESAVRSTKFHLKRILNLTHLTYEEMSTCLTQIEAILNSRPLTPLSTDPTDMSALTPAHFLIGRSLTSVPCPQIADDVNINLLQRHKRIDVIKQHFWRRFANDYVFTLQQKSKWLTSSSPSLKVDSLVLVKDKVNPPLMWCLGRVTRLYPGPDGINRVADVKTRRGTLRRGWNNLCPLPMDQDL